MVRRCLFLAVSAVLIAGHLVAHAQSQQPITHCSNWLKGGQVRTALEHWLIGYMSGMSTVWEMQGLKPANPGGRIKKNADLFLYVDAHCRLNTGDDVSVAGFKLFRELASQK